MPQIPFGKLCTKCRKQKPYSEFYKRQSGNFSLWCKDCNNNIIFEKEREATLKYNYGLTLLQYETILKSQEGVCVICGLPETKKYRGKIICLAVDHDHKTGKIRGLLCSRCNTAIGLAKDDPQILRNMAKYLERSRNA